MARLIEPQECVTMGLHPVFQPQRLGSRHVGPKAAQKHHTRAFAWQSVIGKAAALGCCQVIGHSGNLSPYRYSSDVAAGQPPMQAPRG